MEVSLSGWIAFQRRPGDAVEPADETDITDRIRPVERGGDIFTAERGRNRPDRQPDTSTAKLWVDNRDRALDPTHETSPHWPHVLPRRLAGVRAHVDAAVYDLFTGMVEGWPQVADSPDDAWVPLSLVGLRKWLGGVDLDLDLPRQPSGARINAILDAAGLPAGARNIDAGTIEVEPLEGTDINALDAIDDTADAEEGLFFFAGNGDATFHDRHHRLDAAEPIITFGPDVADGHVDYPAIKMPFDDEHIVNDARVELADRTVRRAIDHDSIAEHGHLDDARMDLPLRPVAAEGLALWIVVRWADAQIRVDRVGLDALIWPDQFVNAITAELSDRTRLVRRPPGGGSDIVLEHHIEKVDHTVTGTSWRVDFTPSPYFGQGPWLAFDDADAGFDLGMFAP